MQFFKHQTEALDQTKDKNKVAYYLDMGLGKTFVGAEKMIRLQNKVNLVVCQKSKVDDWVNHFKTYYHAKVFDLTKPKEFGEFHGVVMGGRFTSIGVINYDLIFRREILYQLKDFTLMLDESSLIQNDKAKRTKFILGMYPSNVILLSGTPTSGKYENLWTQLHLLGWTISQDTYNKQYINWTLTKDDGSGIRHKIVNKDDSYKNVDRLKEKMREHGAVFMKTEECFDLPEQTFITVNCESSKEYRKFKKHSIVKFDDVELVGDTTLTKMLYLRMLCGQYNTEKLDAFKDLVQSTNDRLIVFYNFKEEAKKLITIANELDRPWAIISGGIKSLADYDNYDNSITFVQYQAGSMGLNLQKANKIVYFTLPLMSEHFEQSKKRIHRIGQDRPCFYYMMLCKGTIEEDILQTLELRKDYTDYLFKENNDDNT
jgi:SNF2 family DNA or RNA helicase